MILENKTSKILDFDHPQKLLSSKICKNAVIPKKNNIIVSDNTHIVNYVLHVYTCLGWIQVFKYQNCNIIFDKIDTL